MSYITNASARASILAALVRDYVDMSSDRQCGVNVLLLVNFYFHLRWTTVPVEGG